MRRQTSQPSQAKSRRLQARYKDCCAGSDVEISHGRICSTTSRWRHALDQSRRPANTSSDNFIMSHDDCRSFEAYLMLHEDLQSWTTKFKSAETPGLQITATAVLAQSRSPRDVLATNTGKPHLRIRSLTHGIWPYPAAANVPKYLRHSTLLEQRAQAELSSGLLAQQL